MQASQLQRDDDGESSFHFISLTSDKDLPSPRKFPIFDAYHHHKSLFTISDPVIQDDDHDHKLAALGDQFRALFVGDERDHPPSSSSDEEEHEQPGALNSGRFCVWSPSRPAGSESPIGWSRKSRSTGSTANWLRLKDLILRRSNSDGKAKLLNSMVKGNREQKAAAAEKEKRATKKASPQEVFYVRTKAIREEERRKTYLPYRRGLIGIFH